MKNKVLMLSLIALSSLIVGCGGNTSSSITSSSSSESTSNSSSEQSSSSEKVNYLINNLTKLHDQQEKNYTIKYDSGTNDKADIVYCTKNAIYRDANNSVDIAGYAEDDKGVFIFSKTGGKLYKGDYELDDNYNYIKDLYSFTVSLGAYKDKVAPVFTSLDVSKYETDLSRPFPNKPDMIQSKNNDMCYFILCLGWDQTFAKDVTWAFVSSTENEITYEFHSDVGVILNVTIYDIGTTVIEGVDTLFND